MSLENEDKRIFDIIKGEEERESSGLDLIPSENYVSSSVREALGSVLTNKYAEGYPGKRYYGGQEFTDEVEKVAIERACRLFNAKYANVQPHSGAPANLAVYFGLLDIGDTILGMDLSHGGHLTHGSPVTEITKVFNFVHYKMKDIETGEIDYDSVREIALKEKPKIILIGFSSYSREPDYQKFVDIAREVDAYVVADMAHISGLIVAGVAKNPFDFGVDVITTTTHKTLRGPRGGLILIRESEDLAKKINKAVFPGLQGGPHMNTIAAKAVAFNEAMQPSFKTYAEQILKNAKAMEEVFTAYNICMIGGGTSNHLLLIDVEKSFRLSGKEAQELLESVGITLNKNVIPDDKRKPNDPSGIRLGTPAITTRGLIEEDSKEVAELIVKTLSNKDNKEEQVKTKNRIQEIAKSHKIPKSFV